ncbi:MAG: A/G-specific adenine glycosylase [Alphaproteobacteria bacterium]|nr:A/G-specific adenine glycosylase [Alphaproteobacteria bacterium]
MQQTSSAYRPGDAPAARLLDWYDRHRRRLPWRAAPGETADPYRVWLSEIMLQQTTVATVGPYFERFVARWPTVERLAAAALDDVLHAWQGLGYYARARNLHKCAQAVAAEHGGRFPDSEAALRKLPGVGRYTAAAIAAIAFDRPAVVVDGNVERVMARLFKVEEPLPDSKARLYELAETLSPDLRPGDYAQAVMDLGATVCTPRSPRCLLCPWSGECAGKEVAESLPRKRPKSEKPTRRGMAFWLERRDGAILLRRRPERGLLGGMMEVPSTDWREIDTVDPTSAAAEAPLAPAEWRMLPGQVRHGFTHFHLELLVAAGRVKGRAPKGCVWCPPDAFGDHALPTVMKKIVRHALAHA